VEERPDWSRSAPARLIELSPLTSDEAGAVVEHVLGDADLDDEVKERVVEAAEGNPLFVEQLLSMLVDEGLVRFEDGRWRATAAVDHVSVPPTIQALLAARLDRLAQDERAVIEPAAVIGHLFVRDAVEHLAVERIRPAVGAHLRGLTEKQLVRPDRSRPAEEEPYRFQHILIRDTTYEGILKRARAALHERFVEWADSVNREGAVEYEEILGYHLEQAHRYLSELGPLDEHGLAVGADGARRLASAGHRAFARGDVPASANLLGRAAALYPDTDQRRLELLPELGEALLQTGRFQEAEETLDEAIRLGEQAGAPRVMAGASLVRLLVRLRAGDPERWRDEAAETIAEAMAVFQEAGDHAGLAKSWRLLAWSHGTACRMGDAAAASERALQEARLAGDLRQETLTATAYAAAAALGPTPVGDAIEHLETIIGQITGDRQSEALLLALLGSLRAMQGEFDAARELNGRSKAMLEELRLPVRLAYVGIEAWRVEMAAGDVVAAEAEMRRSYDILVELGEKYLLSTVSGLLGQTLYVLGRFDEVEPLGTMARELATDDDVYTQALWRCVQGKHLARTGAFVEAESLVREAIGLLEPTDVVLLKLFALLDLAEVRRVAGLDEHDQLAEARRLAEAKASPVYVDLVDELLGRGAPKPLAS
jgi:tetratricopeptide (TPR) repeat protein